MVKKSKGIYGPHDDKPVNMAPLYYILLKNKLLKKKVELNENDRKYLIMLIEAAEKAEKLPDCAGFLSI